MTTSLKLGEFAVIRVRSRSESLHSRKRLQEQSSCYPHRLSWWDFLEEDRSNYKLQVLFSLYRSPSSCVNKRPIVSISSSISFRSLFINLIIVSLEDSAVRWERVPWIFLENIVIWLVTRPVLIFHSWGELELFYLSTSCEVLMPWLHFFALANYSPMRKRRVEEKLWVVITPRKNLQILVFFFFMYEFQTLQTELYKLAVLLSNLYLPSFFHEQSP